MGTVYFGVDELKKFLNSSRILEELHKQFLLKKRIQLSNVSVYLIRNLLEILYHKDAYSFLLAPYSSRTYLFPHQLAVMDKVVNELDGKAILADEVGLGKTIEAGLIMKELIIRKRIKKILILVPASLTTQWHEEMSLRFNEDFIVYDAPKRAELEQLYKNIWEAHDKIIVSLSTAKQEKYRKGITAVHWDMVIVDEAHKLKNSATLNHKLVKELKKDHILLLTATPLQNSLEELYNLASLVNKKIFGSKKSFMKKYQDCHGDPKLLAELRERLEKVMIRNRRVDVQKDVTFPQRRATTVRVTLTEEEEELYKAVTKYVKKGYQYYLQNRNNTYVFYLILVQRMLTSSVEALCSTLRNRLAWLESVKSEGGEAKITITRFMENQVDVEYTIGDEDGYIDANLYDQVEEETNRIREILRAAEKVKKSSKLEKLKKLVRKILSSNPEEKVLIFTEFRATQDFLARELGKEFPVVIFNGSMNAKEKDRAVSLFKNEKQILISTEAGGEGRNLQFCHIVVNYDLPWNPMRVEQRIGRVHRIGQKRDVQIINFSTAGTIEEHLLNILETKIKLFEGVIGDIDTILGTATGEKNFETLIFQILSEMESEEEIKEAMEELGEKIEKAKEEYSSGKLVEFQEERLNLSLENQFSKFRNVEKFFRESELKTIIEEYLNQSRIPVNFDQDIIHIVPPLYSKYNLPMDGYYFTFDREILLENFNVETLEPSHPFIKSIYSEMSGKVPVIKGTIHWSPEGEEGEFLRKLAEEVYLFTFTVNLDWLNYHSRKFVTYVTDGTSTRLYEKIPPCFAYPVAFPSDAEDKEEVVRVLEKSLPDLAEKMESLVEVLLKEGKKLVEKKIEEERFKFQDKRYELETLLAKLNRELRTKKKKMRNSPYVSPEELKEERKVKKTIAKILQKMMKLEKDEQEHLVKFLSPDALVFKVELISAAKLLNPFTEGGF